MEDVPSIARYPSTVGLSDTLLAIGVPRMVGVGPVSTYRMGEDGIYVPFQELLSPQENSGFGYSVDVSGTALVVGAPFAIAPGTTSEAGAAYLIFGTTE